MLASSSLAFLTARLFSAVGVKTGRGYQEKYSICESEENRRYQSNHAYTVEYFAVPKKVEAFNKWFQTRNTFSVLSTHNTSLKMK